MITRTKHMLYTKENGEQSERLVIVVSAPKINYLVYDVTKLEQTDINVLLDALSQADEYRENALKDFELITGIQQRNLWRSFKPEGIEWTDEI